MAWWVLTFLKHYPAPAQLIVRAVTNVVAYPYLTASYHKPIKEPIYKKVRGTWKFCGYNYTWYKAKIFAHLQTGDSWNHTYQLLDLQPGQVIWYYIWSPGGPYGRECQGPLCHVLIPRRMIGARVTRLTPQWLHHDVEDVIVWDHEYYDDAHFWEPAPNPERLTIPFNGFFKVGCNVGITTGPVQYFVFRIRDNSGRHIAGGILPIQPEPGVSWIANASTYHYYQKGDYLECFIRTHGIGDCLLALDAQCSPIFWIYSI